MAWSAPDTGNTASTKVTNTLHNEISSNLLYLKERADTVDSNLGQELNTDSSPNFENITLTGLTGTVEGRIETNASDIETLESKVGQSLNTDDNVSFTTVNTGQGANELYDMNQNVKTTDAPTFAGLSLTGRLNPTTTPTSGTWTIGAVATMIIPRGQYNIETSSNTSIAIQISDGSTWHNMGSGMGFFSDGINVRLSNTTAGSKTLQYLKF